MGDRPEAGSPLKPKTCTSALGHGRPCHSDCSLGSMWSRGWLEWVKWILGKPPGGVGVQASIGGESEGRAMGWWCVGGLLL